MLEVLKIFFGLFTLSQKFSSNTCTSRYCHQFNIELTFGRTVVPNSVFTSYIDIENIKTKFPNVHTVFQLEHVKGTIDPFLVCGVKIFENKENPINSKSLNG